MMNTQCDNCGGKLVYKYKINLRNIIIFLVYLLALFFSFILLIRFSGWYGAVIFLSIAGTIGWAIREYYERYSECTQCKTKS